jgi:3-oxoacyl-[acyl-carrier-protein] synthase II
MDKRRVVVTGMGIISPLGNSVTETWRNILAGKSGIAAIDRFDVSEFATRIGGAIKNFDINDYMSAKEAKRFDPFIHYGVAAAEQALEDSGIEVNDTNAHRIGTAIGSGIGGIGLIENSRQILNNGGPRKISPFTVPGAIINMIAGVVAIKHNLQGPSIAIATACTTGTHNIGMAARMIAYGDADAMLAGGAEMATTPVGLGAFAAARAMSTRNDDPERASRPWDKNRDGFVLGDGAGMLMLEEYEFAKRRGAHIHA